MYHFLFLSFSLLFWFGLVWLILCKEESAANVDVDVLLEHSKKKKKMSSKRKKIKQEKFLAKKARESYPHPCMQFQFNFDSKNRSSLVDPPSTKGNSHTSHDDAQTSRHHI